MFVVALTLQRHAIVACDRDGLLTRHGPGSTEGVPYACASAAEIVEAKGAPGAFPIVAPPIALRTAVEGRTMLVLAGIDAAGSPFLLTRSPTRLLTGPHHTFRTGLSVEMEKLVELERFVSGLQGRIQVVPEEQQLKEVLWALPVFVRRMSLATIAVAPTGQIAIAGPDGARIEAF